MKKSTIITIVLVVLVAVAAFFGGMKYQQSKSPFANRQTGNFQRNITGNGQLRNGNGGQNFRPVAGEITAMDDKSITVKSQDGSSKIVILSQSTSINKTDTAAKTDLQVGSTVSVFGTANSDGSITAQNVQLNPLIRQQGQ